ncbi:MAG: hypothetical protein NZT61_02735 [Deltaproteobacteria bacterium]|nr:hypothetical protein [Deltaproteobacteria bacterium]MCX7952711.1 hypothetical protein [Deltaproteobacteria bacterium]
MPAPLCIPTTVPVKEPPTREREIPDFPWGPEPSEVPFPEEFPNIERDPDPLKPPPNINPEEVPAKALC